VNWQIKLSSDPTPWLLEGDNPPIRYLALRDLLELPLDDPELTAARESVLDWPPLAELLADQHPAGYWIKPDFYLPRASRGTFWVLTVLGDLGLTSELDPIQRACGFMFEQQREDGAFCRHRRVPKQGVVWEEASEPCTQARIVRFLIQFGYGDDPRVKKAVDWLLKRQREDGMWHCRGEEGRGCLRATIDALRAVSLIPGLAANPRIQEGAAVVCQLSMQPGMYRYHVGEKWGTWESLKYPTFGFSVLSALDALGRLGRTVDDPGVRRCLDYLLSCQLPKGPWPLDESWPESPLDFGEIGQPNKWITLDAMRVLKMFV